MNRKLVCLPYHAVVQDAIRQWCAAGVLAVQVLADHLNVRLLTHLLGRLHAEADVASVEIDTWRLKKQNRVNRLKKINKSTTEPTVVLLSKKRRITCRTDCHKKTTKNLLINVNTTIRSKHCSCCKNRRTNTNYKIQINTTSIMWTSETLSHTRSRARECPILWARFCECPNTIDLNILIPTRNIENLHNLY